MAVNICTQYATQQTCRFGTHCRFRHDHRKCTCGLIVYVYNFDAHFNGKRHKKLLKQYKRTDDINVVEEIVQCSQCKKHVVASHMADHRAEHVRRTRLTAIKDEIARNEEDKNGVMVSETDGIDFGVVDEGESQSLRRAITIQVASKVRVALDNFLPTGSDSFSIELLGQSSRWITSRHPKTLAVTFTPSGTGLFEGRLNLVFFHVELKTRFIITRKLSATVGSKDDHDLLKAKVPFNRIRRPCLRPEGKIKRYDRPTSWTPTAWKKKLLPFDIPTDLLTALFAEESRGRQANNVKRFMPATFDLRTYARCFQVMIWIEEIELKHNLDAYAMEDVTIKAVHPRYRIPVPGLAEGRPSVMMGDFIRVKFSDSDEDIWYEGIVHAILEDFVDVKFGEDFNMYRGTKFDVRFVLNRMSLRRMHHALTNKNDQERILFPDVGHLIRKMKVSSLEMNAINTINRNIGTDEEQLQTVAAIVHQPPGDVPFILFGPPGTGKTVTIVEAMRQLLAKDPNCRILACTPNNSAADLLATSLTALGRTSLFRLNSLTRDFKKLPDTLRQFSCYNDNSVFAIPPGEDLAKYRVVVATCISGGVPDGLGLKRGHFSHIFIDEAGQAKEPEIMIPIKTMAGPKTNIVLAGDPKQLGPIVHSAAAGSMGLKTSYLVRLMEREIYSLETGADKPRAGGRGLTVVKLVKNFRSHPAILEFSNRNFYDGELQPVGNPAVTHRLENNDALPKKGFPVVFHSIVGKDERESSSPSFFNIAEATKVKEYCLMLVSNRKQGITGDKIIVIAPYHAQVVKLRTLFKRDPKLEKIRVGSIEEFQGQESPVVILSTVRSSTEHLESDIKRTLGFVASPQRLNVALTRAQSMLMVIGNPVVLGLDPLWRTFLSFVYSKGGWTGKPSRPGWSADAAVDTSSTAPRFDVQLRDQAMGESEELLERLRALVIQRLDDDRIVYDLDDDDEGMHDDIAVFRRED